MIDGTALVLLGTLILVALCRAAYRSIWYKGWHAGRAALIREQQAERQPTIHRNPERPDDPRGWVLVWEDRSSTSRASSTHPNRAARLSTSRCRSSRAR